MGRAEKSKWASLRRRGQRKEGRGISNGSMYLNNSIPPWDEHILCKRTVLNRAILENTMPYYVEYGHNN